MRTADDPCAERINAILETTEIERNRLLAEITVLKARNLGLADEVGRQNTIIIGLRTSLALMQEQIEKNG